MGLSRKVANLRQQYGGGRYFIFYRDFLAAFSDTEAIMLGYLCNVAQQKRTVWFRCTRQKMQYNLRWKLDKQNHVLNKLQTRGVIRIKQMGNPAKRHIQINYLALQGLVKQGLAAMRDFE